MNLTNALRTATPAADAREALATYNTFREGLGFGPASFGRALLTPPTANAKFDKTDRPVYGLSLAPHRDAARILGVDLVGDLTVCPWSTPACRAACVSYAGNGAYPKVQRARAVKTAFAANHPAEFLALLLADIERSAERDPDAAVRLNTFSDVAWERVLPREAFGLLPAYDYTKGGIKRFRAAREVGYRVVLSVSERTNLTAMDGWLAEGATAAVVFPTSKRDALPATWRGHRVVDGDKTDDRLADPEGVIVGLRAKGRLLHKANTAARVFIRGAA
jgi:hypothetical protein